MQHTATHVQHLNISAAHAAQTSLLQPYSCQPVGKRWGQLKRLQQRWGDKTTTEVGWKGYKAYNSCKDLAVPWHTWQTWHTRQTWQIAMCHQGYEGDKLQCITHKTHSNISQVAGSQPKCHQACTKYVSPSMCHEATCLSSSSRHLFRAYAISPRRRITHHT